MSAHIRAFNPYDALRLTAQPAQAVQAGIVQEPMGLIEAEALAAGGPAWTCETADARIVAIAGLLTTFTDAETGAPCQAYCWAVLAERIGVSAHLAMTRGFRDLLAVQPHRRIEAACHADRPEELRWLLAIGFQPLTIKHGFGADGGSIIECERVRL
jgi:hypothetical protein